MAFGYLLLALVLAFALNYPNRFLRAMGALIAALGLFMITISIVLAEVDGTFAAFSAGAFGLEVYKPLILGAQAVAASIAIPFLLWAGWTELRRPAVETTPLRNSTRAFGLVSRALHWAMAVMIFCLIPIGLFFSVLPKSSADRASFLSAHQSLGLTVLALVFVRLAWLKMSPAPAPSAGLTSWERFLALSTRVCLYLIAVGFPLSGFFVNAFQAEAVDLYGWTIPLPFGPDARIAALASAAHAVALPLAFYAAIFAHVGAVMKHHFIDRRVDEIRRMIA
ncbi:MAG: cytochrome b [Methylocystis sp.]